MLASKKPSVRNLKRAFKKGLVGVFYAIVQNAKMLTSQVKLVITAIDHFKLTQRII